MTDKIETKIFSNEAQKYWDRGDSVVPIIPNTKKAIPNWSSYANSLPNLQTREKWLHKYAYCGIGLLTGTSLGNGLIRGALDIDENDYVEPISRALGAFPSAKKGKKGLTIFFITEQGVKSMAINSDGKRITDVLLSGRQTIIPPTLHADTGLPYEWNGIPIYEVDPNALPHLSADDLRLLKEIIENQNHKAIMAGEATHDAALSLVASLAGKFNDAEKVCRYIEAFLPVNYTGNLRKELPEMFSSAKEKGLGKKTGRLYDPGTEGPIPVGYTANNYYVFMDQKKKILSICAPKTLMSAAGLYDLAPASFWRSNFPFPVEDGPPKIDVPHAADTLMQKCREAGPFIADKVRGCGIWREGEQIILNLRGEKPEVGDHIYVRFLSLPEFMKGEKVDAQEFLKWLMLFKWEKPGYGVLVLGWASLAIICGALEWRPHIFINGPKNSGKSTIIEGLSHLLYPMVVTLDGGSTEAGIRQTIGADSRPVILDEFESDHDIHRMQRIIKTIRSTSSAKGAIARGTPEGKALQFQLYSSFCLGAINPLRGTAADASRIVNLGLSKHDNDRDVNRLIQEGVSSLHRSRSAWPHQMLELAPVMLENIKMFEGSMPPGDSRHNKNMAALIGSAFTVLNEKAASKEDAEKMISEFSDVIGHLAQAHEEKANGGALVVWPSKWKGHSIKITCISYSKVLTSYLFARKVCSR